MYKVEYQDFIETDTVLVSCNAFATPWNSHSNQEFQYHGMSNGVPCTIWYRDGRTGQVGWVMTWPKFGPTYSAKVTFTGGLSARESVVLQVLSRYYDMTDRSYMTMIM